MCVCVCVENNDSTFAEIILLVLAFLAEQGDGNVSQCHRILKNAHDSHDDESALSA